MQPSFSAARSFRPSAECFVLSAWISLGLATPGHAQQGQGAAAAPTSAGGAVTLFQNVRIFDGKSGRLPGPSHVLVRGNRIERISATPICARASALPALQRLLRETTPGRRIHRCTPPNRPMVPDPCSI